jgi:hypothetical protein
MKDTNEKLSIFGLGEARGRLAVVGLVVVAIVLVVYPLEAVALSVTLPVIKWLFRLK